MVYDLVYDEHGNIIDAILMQSGHGRGKYYVMSKIPTSVKIGDNISFGSGNHYLYYNGKLNTNYEYGLTEGSLNITQITKDSTWKKLSGREYSVLRFIHQDKNGYATLCYNGTDNNERVYNNEIITLPNKTLARLKFSNLFIEKTISEHADDIVETNDELTYSIVIKNNSKNDYTDDIIVSETISEYVEYKSYEVNKEIISINNDIKNHNKIEWNIGKLKSGEEVIIRYKVTVKENCFGETISSVGYVDNIPSAVINNKIGKNLTEQQKNNIKKKYNELKKQYSGKELINEIYKSSFGINLELDNFKITELIVDTDKDSTKAQTLSLNENNVFYNLVLNKYWSSLYKKMHTYLEPNDIAQYDLKLWKSFDLLDRRADTIYSENFKTGDILIYTNNNDVTYSYNNNEVSTTPITYENGEYAYIYIEGEGFVGVNFGDDEIAGTQDDRNEFNAKYYSDNGLSVYSNKKETDEKILEFANYQTLFGKDYYVILRPTLGINIKEIIPGDVNEDEKVTATDLLKVKKHIVGLELLSEKEILLGDVDGNGKISSTDIIKIKRIIVKIDK